MYVPAQYRPDKPACVYINQDGIQWKAPVVFDNLIHSKEIPVTIGVFVMHGQVKAASEATALNRYNRSYEYDGLGDHYAHFLLKELLPEVEKQKASDGRPIRLSKNANDRAIGGSSGAVCAFGITLSPDGSQLYVTESASHWVWAYTVQPEGALANKQRFGWLHEPDTAGNAWADGIKCDTAGRIYVATRLGVQVLDQMGRVNAILPLPQGAAAASNLCFGGPGFQTLYVTAGSKVYRRTLNTRGAQTFEPYRKPVRPGL